MNKYKSIYKYKNEYYKSIEEVTIKTDYGIKMAYYISELSGVKPNLERIPCNRLMWILLGFDEEDDQ